MVSRKLSAAGDNDGGDPDDAPAPGRQLLRIYNDRLDFSQQLVDYGRQFPADASQRNCPGITVEQYYSQRFLQMM